MPFIYKLIPMGIKDNLHFVLLNLIIIKAQFKLKAQSMKYIWNSVNVTVQHYHLNIMSHI